MALWIMANDPAHLLEIVACSLGLETQQPYTKHYNRNAWGHFIFYWWLGFLQQEPCYSAFCKTPSLPVFVVVLDQNVINTDTWLVGVLKIVTQSPPLVEWEMMHLQLKVEPSIMKTMTVHHSLPWQAHPAGALIHLTSHHPAPKPSRVSPYCL